jgi:ribose transport system permease protein
VAAGLINSIIVTALRVNPFVATLGSASIFTGIALLASGSGPALNSKPGFEWLSQSKVGSVPFPIILLFAAFLIGGFVLHRTVFGRSVYAVGGNREAARLTGLRVNAVASATFLISGVFSVVGGMLVASQSGVGQADAVGTVTLDAIAVVVIGGTSLLGGEGAMWRTVVGLFILGTINNLFSSMALPVATQSIAKGSILIVAVAVDVLVRSRRSRA